MRFSIYICTYVQIYIKHILGILINMNTKPHEDEMYYVLLYP